jgi:hypothetical protein
MSTKISKRTISLLRASLLATLGLLSVACNSHVGECTSPKVDPETQLTSCSEGYSHRALAVRCEPVTSSAPMSKACETDCSELSNGYCDNGYGPLLPECKSGCVVDSDCASGFVCVCGDGASPTGGVCRQSDCRTDADCSGDSLCASGWEQCGAPRFLCQSDDDECMTSDDCDESEGCAIDSSGHRKCSGIICGRPFLVLARPHLPPVAARADWLLTATPRVDQLSAAERAAQAEHWTKLGQMEHASIAAFARFSLQLLSLGAPADLVEACTQALADETAHTQLCFGLASAYAGRAIGPGPLDITGSLDVSSLEDIVDLVIAEGCFGETSAALEALEAAETASDPVIRAAYAQIASDEQRHAELAFRFVRWALEQDSRTVTAQVAAAIAGPPSSDGAATGVAVPCLQALLQLTAPAPAATRLPANLPA